jgi:bifunctional UDP-N-acetylglucosamine pyrophosphorylase / glucosamine-1-phosphate N-acetyltransferase
MDKNTVAIILAAGKGERMKSALPKVMHEICLRPMVLYVRDLVRDLKIKKSVAVVGFKGELVSPLLEDSAKIVAQKKLLGSGDAVKAALAALKGFRGTVLILYGDIPLLKKESIEKLLTHHIGNRCDVTLLTAVVDKPAGYGRILRDKYASICGIIEEKDADDFQKGIKEVNTGIICFHKDALAKALPLIKANNRKKEYYLTDAIGILYTKGASIDSVRIEDVNEALGINSRVELARANAIMQKRINDGFMKEGVTIVDPASAFIGYGVKIGKDTVIYPFTVIERNVTIGENCSVGPFVHLREGTRLSDNVSVGNFVELVRTAVSSHTLVKHFGYIGDTTIGQGVNIGAGFVTANFDGAKKNSTVIKDGAFIGSDTILVAPVTIGRGAKTGAGSVVVKNQNVPDGEVVAGVPARLLKIKKR